MDKVLDVQDLKVYYQIQRGFVKAVENVNFYIKKGEALGLAGESGCGKTTIALALLRLLPSNARIIQGKILFRGKDCIQMSDEEIRKEIRWKGISIVFQGAMNALNPVFKISDQITEAIRLHEPQVTKEEALKRAEKLFSLVGLEPSRVHNYSHEFSGGMRQRAMIAMALASNPEMLIADEPGTALDVIIQAQILGLLRQLKEKLDLSMILITHDLSIIAETCERVAIMYAGKLVENADVTKLFKEPLHPYTQGLIGAFPDIHMPKVKLSSIPGSPPDLLDPPEGCRFYPRCKYAMEICRDKIPETREVEKEHFVACHLF